MSASVRFWFVCNVLASLLATHHCFFLDESSGVKLGQLRLDNEISFPFVASSHRNYRYFGIGFIGFPVFVDTGQYFNETSLWRLGRSLQDDQLEFYGVVQKYFRHYGLDAETCLLRLVCDVEKFSLLKNSVMGKFVATLFLPLVSNRQEFRKYHEARRIGGSNATTCAALYSSCTFSLENIIGLVQSEENFNVDD